MTDTEPRRYAVRARSTDTFGRVLCNSRDQHLVVDGPVQNGCPGEAITPAEIFLAGIAACGVELLQAVARDSNVALRSVEVSIQGVIDRNRPVRSDVNVFNSVEMAFTLGGVDRTQADLLIGTFKRR